MTIFGYRLMNFADAAPQMKQGANLEVCGVEPLPTEAPTDAPEASTESPCK